MRHRAKFSSHLSCVVRWRRCCTLRIMDILHARRSQHRFVSSHGCDRV